MLIHPTLRMQSWGFAIGSLLFALGSAPVLSTALGTLGANISFFAGSWFFTGAAFIQLVLSGAALTTERGKPAIRAEWLSAAVQFMGTLLFNVSTGAALYTHTLEGQMHYGWNPNAGGSVAFLISSALAILMLNRQGLYWAPKSVDWQSGWFNMLGSVAFGVSAVGAFIVPTTGNLEDPTLANWGTFVGALCFFVASVVYLVGPRRSEPEPELADAL